MSSGLVSVTTRWLPSSRVVNTSPCRRRRCRYSCGRTARNNMVWASAGMRGPGGKTISAVIRAAENLIQDLRPRRERVVDGKFPLPCPGCRGGYYDDDQACRADRHGDGHRRAPDHGPGRDVHLPPRAAGRGGQRRARRRHPPLARDRRPARLRPDLANPLRGRRPSRKPGRGPRTDLTDHRRGWRLPRRPATPPDRVGGRRRGRVDHRARPAGTRGPLAVRAPLRGVPPPRRQAEEETPALATTKGVPERRVAQVDRVGGPPAHARRAGDRHEDRITGRIGPVATKPVIIDTDPGIDDAIAIFLALAAPELDIAGLTTVYGNCTVEVATRNALTLLDVAGRSDIPVARGAAAPIATDYL